MFNNIRDEILRLNSDVNDVVNCEKARKLKKKLLCIGLPMAIIGFLGLFTCFVLFATAGFDAFGPNGFTNRIIIPFILFLPFGFVGMIGASITSLAMKIVVIGYGTNFVDQAKGNRCPKCGDVVETNELFCTKCGTPLQLKCPKCGMINDYKNDFCKNCGEKLKTSD